MNEIDPAELEARGLYDPDAADADKQLELIAKLLGAGARIEELERDSGVLTAVALDLAFRPRSERYGLGEAAEIVGVVPATAERAWRALGLAAPSDDEDAGLTGDEAEMLRVFADAADILGPDLVAQLYRVIGMSVTRIADATVDALRLDFENPLREGGAGDLDIIALYEALADEYLPRINSLIETLLRHQLVVRARELWITDAAKSAALVDVAVGFADIVGYTALARRSTIAELSRALSDFEQIALDAATARHGRIVKLIGDEVMFVCHDPSDACRLAFDIQDATAATDELTVRVGIAAGHVVTREGDYHGEIVNTASRLTALAAPGEILVEAAVAERAGEDFRFEARPPHTPKGFDAPVTPYAPARAT